MIVPGIGAIVVVGAGGAAIALAAAVLPQAAPVWVGAALAIAIVVSTDAVLALREARGLTVRSLRLFRVVCGREFDMPLTVSNSRRGGAAAREVRIAPLLPAGLRSSADSLDCGSPGPRQQIAVTAELTCSQRGELTLTACAVRSRSPCGLWNVQSVLPLNTTIRAYPDLLKDRAAAEFLQRGKAGERVIRHSGKGREFEKLRDYAYGDSWDEIDWKATARRGKPVVRVFQAERTQEIYVALDSSRLSGRTAGGRITLDRYVNAALMMALAAESQGDRFGLITFSGRVHGFVRAQKGKAHFKTCREAIYNVKPRGVEPDFGEFFAFLLTHLRRRALVIVLTALDDPLAAETFSHNVAIAGRRHLVIAAMPASAGARPLFEMPAADLEQIYDQLSGHLRWRRLAELQKNCRRKGVALHLLPPGKFSGQLAGVYLDVKRRQLL